MTISAQRKAIIKYLESADKEQIQVIYNLFVESEQRMHDFTLSDEDKNEIEILRTRYLSGEEETFTLEQVMAQVKEHRQRKK
ncbi:MAG: hypothetical protein MUC87_01495 [Bacteroidia bacterium]|jgi:hypothetical protein|nr:hypothetical protein [Bacteroidia bacterium]